MISVPSKVITKFKFVSGAPPAVAPQSLVPSTTIDGAQPIIAKKNVSYKFNSGSEKLWAAPKPATKKIIQKNAAIVKSSSTTKNAPNMPAPVDPADIEKSILLELKP